VITPHFAVEPPPSRYIARLPSPKSAELQPRGNEQGDDRPVVNVSRVDCLGFCGKLGVSLPTEAQWEFAARGPEGRAYPWGDDWDAAKCCNADNLGPGGSTFPSGTLAQDASFCGALDLAGNVREWCGDFYRFYRDSPRVDPRTTETSPDVYTVRVEIVGNRPMVFNVPQPLARGGAWTKRGPEEFRTWRRKEITTTIPPAPAQADLGLRVGHGL